MAQTGPEGKPAVPPPALPSAALTAKVIPLEAETEVETLGDNIEADSGGDACAATEVAGDADGKDGKDGSTTAPPAEDPVVVEEDEQGGGPAYHEVACLCLSVGNPLRAAAIKIYDNPNFDRFTLTVIGANCVTLGMFNPLDPDCETQKCKMLTIIDQTFAIYFTFECAVKMLALGAFSCGAEREAYFDTRWNQFDFMIVVTSLIDFLPFVEGPLSALRTFRVLRPLRAINKFPKMRVLVKLLLDTIPMLASVGMLCFFIFFVFGIIAVQFWKGIMHQRCFDPSIASNSSGFSTSYYQTDDGDGEDPYICATGSGAAGTGLSACIDSQGVPSNFSVCRLDGPRPLNGAIHYDNILATWIVLFQIITLEGWVDQMYFIQGAYSFHLGWIFFCSLVVIGAFFAVNLALVVISSQFGDSKGSEMAAIEAAEAKAKEEQKRRYAEAKARGETLSIWQQFQSGDLFSKADEQIEAERNARIENLTAIAASMENADEKTTVEQDIARLQNNEDFPITQAEATAQGGMQVHRYAVRKFAVIDERFGNFIMAAIALNVLLMATEHHGQPQGLTSFLEISNYVFCAIFAIEMLLKWFALGFPCSLEYFEDSFNCFDCLIVFISFLELAMGGGGLSVLRMLRLVRVFKLVKFLPELQRQFAIMGETLGSVLSFLTLLALFIFIFAVLGMFIFGGSMEFQEEDDDGTIYYITSRKNFDNLLWALVTIFQTLTLEDWNAGMYEAVRGTETQLAAVYYILLIMLGNYIMFNLFVAILIDGFGAEEDEEEAPAEADGELVDTLRGNPLEGAAKGRRVSKAEAQEMLAAVANLHAHPSAAAASQHSSSKASEGSGVGSCSGARATSSRSSTGRGSGVGDAGAAAAGVSELETVVSDAPATLNDTSKPAESSAAKYVPDEEGPLDVEQGATDDMKESAAPRDLALCIFAPDNALRLKCKGMIVQPWFDQFIMACILLNSIQMAIERPSIPDGSTERQVLDILGHIFSFIFSVEMIIKLIALGLFYGPAPYWSNAWNRLDGIIVSISWVDVILTIAGVTGGMLSLLKICRMLRALRPLRAISRLPGLRKIVNVLIMSLAPIGTTLIIVGVFFFLFAVLGGQIFSGQFYYCDESDRFIELNNIRTKEDCLNIVGPNAWTNRPYNFDHLGNSLMTLFVLSSIDGWVEIMYHGVDSAGVDMQPQPNNREGLVFFFVLFLLIGGFFIINMFVGVIVENFQKNGAPDPVATDKEPEPEPPYDDFEDRENYPSWRRAVLAHATSTCFESSIAAVIILNVVFMGSEYWDPAVAAGENADADGFASEDGMPAGFKLFLRISNYIFTLIFIYELVVKYVAFGCKRFHMGSHPRSSPSWNNFDWFIVFISILGILIDDVIGADNMPINPSILRILRILRVARILKLLKSAKDLVILLNTVSRSLAQVGNLGLLLFLLFFIYSALGIELFGRLACTDTNGCEGISEYANFDNFGMAMLVLFRLSTGDNWNGMMKDGLRGVPPISNDTALITQYGNEYGCSFDPDCSEPDICCAGCDNSETCKENCCADALMTPLFYISFCVLSTFVMLNLVVATLMGELERAGIESAEEEAGEKDVGAAGISAPEDDNGASAANGVKEEGAGDVEAKALASTPLQSFQRESLMNTAPDLSPVSAIDDGGPPSGSRKKLDPLPPLPMRPPVSHSVFVPFAPETVVQDDEPEGADGKRRVASAAAASK